MNTAIKRAFRILEYLTSESDPKGETLSYIGRQLGIPKSSVFDILESLTELGYVDCSDRKYYRIGSGAAYLGFKVIENNSFFAVTRKHLEQLSEECNLTTFAGIGFGSNLVIVDKLPPRTGMSVSGCIGSTKPIHISAMGKAILAYLPEDTVRDAIGSSCFVSYTRNSIINFNQLFKNLAGVRKNGFAVNNFEEDDYIYGVAAPVFDPSGKVCGAVEASAFVQTLENADLQALAASVKHCAARITEDLKKI